LSEKKSPDVLLQAFASLGSMEGGAELRLVFAGPDDGDMKQKLQRLAGELGVSARVQILGPVFNKDKWSAYRDADVFVLPSQNEKFREHCG